MDTPPGFFIRRATPDDLPIVHALIRELAEFEQLAHEVVATESDLQREIFGANPRAEVVLAGVNEVVVGFAVFFHNFSTFVGRAGLYVEDLFVRPAHRGNGYGRALMIHLARLAHERGCGRFEWAVLDWNQRARDFYASLGAEAKSEWIIQRVTGPALEALAARALFE
jgi:GNAT superfamily N-acetyltransferase